MIDTDIAWVAGIIEGEGAIMLTKNPMRVRIRVCMTDLDVIESLQTKTALGTLSYDWRKRPNRKQVYVWEIRKQAEVEYLLKLILPYMHQRRTEKIMTVLEWIQGRVTIKNCLWCQTEFPASCERNVFCKTECRSNANNKKISMKLRGMS